MNSIHEPRRRTPFIELLLIIGLPLLVMVAGAYTTVVAYERGFTAMPEAKSMVGH